MRYANIIWQNTEIVDSDYRTVNIGDTLQFFSIDYIYQLMGIKHDDIVYLSLYDLKSYRGEKLILPLNWALFDLNYMQDSKLVISEDIEPIFLAVTIESYNHKDEFFNKDNIEYLKKHEPIGCRDYITYKKLSEYGIDSYLNGCNTSLLPLREKKKTQKEILLIDAPIELEEYIPKSMMDSIVSMSQQYYCSQQLGYEEIRNSVKNHYEYIVDHAKLVVTSRLHVACPCIAMGIPVIFVKNKVDNRFSWFQTYIKLYNKNEFDKIDWNPSVIDTEDNKRKILNVVTKRIGGKEITEDEWNALRDIYFYCEGEVIKYQDTIQKNFGKIDTYLSEKYNVRDEFEYVIWGMGKAAENFYEMMCKNYPKARLTGVIDSYRTGLFHEHKVVTPKSIFIEKEKKFLFYQLAHLMLQQAFWRTKGLVRRILFVQEMCL